MFLLPLWPKETSRFPVVTTGLMLANLLVFLIAGPLQHQDMRKVGVEDLQNTAQKLTSILLDPDSHISGSVGQHEHRIKRAALSVTSAH